MSDDQTPEWLRLKRELQALLKGAWDEIGYIDDRLSKLEERLNRIEIDVQSVGRSRLERPPR